MTETHSALAEALSQAQAEMKNAPLNKINPHFKSKYADLAAIRDATLPHLTKHGLAIVQFTKVRDGELLLHTRLLHTSGEFIESEYPLPTALDKPQVMGSAFTYAKRYSWSAMCGISADEDDDANAATTKGNGTIAKPASGQNFGGPLTKTQLKSEMRAFAGDLAACEETDQLTALMNKSAGMLDQCMRDLPAWYYGSDNEVDGQKFHEAGAIDRINEKRAELEERAAMQGAA